MIAAERFSIQYKSKLNRLFYNFTNPDTFSPKTNPSRGDMVQSNLTLNQVHLHLGSEDHSKYGRIFSTHLSFPLNIQSTAQCFLVIRPQKMPKIASLKIAVVGIALSVNIKHTYIIAFRISSSKMQLKFLLNTQLHKTTKVNMHTH